MRILGYYFAISFANERLYNLKLGGHYSTGVMN